MKYMAIIDAYEKPVSCDFIGCNGNVTPYLIGSTTDIKALEQESSYNSINSLVESNLKNPKAKTFDVLHFVADNAGLSTFEAIEKAYNMGVSEQEQVLDKIRAEIEQEYNKYRNMSDKWDERACGLGTALEIIDKALKELNE